MKQYIKMKRYMTKYFALTGGLLMLGFLSGCQLEDPVIPAEELYIRGFIKKYGLIDPTQDFSSAVQTTITLDIPGKASVVNVYAKMGNDLYRVGCFAELQGIVSLPVDVSEATETIVVDVDGVRYYTTQNGHVTVRSGSSAAVSRADSKLSLSDDELKKLWIEPEKWAAETAQNGETKKAYASRKPIVIKNDDKGSFLLSGEGIVNVGGVDYFNIETAAHVGANLANEPTETAIGVNFASGTNPGEVSNTGVGSNVRFLIENNDKTLSAYSFTFRTASKNEADVRVVLLGQHKNGPNAEGKYENGDGVYIFMDSKNLKVSDKENLFGTFDNVTTSDKLPDGKDNGKYTEWELRTDLLPKGCYELIIMGVDATMNGANDKTCGNWGFMTMKRIKTATDMRWILACEDLGTTDDFDFNDVVFSIEAVNTNTAAIKLGVIQWQVVDVNGNWNNKTGEGGTVIHPAKAPASRDGETPVNSEYKSQIKVTALAAGGTLPIWLHFREEEGDGSTVTGTDYLVCPSQYKKHDNGIRDCLVEIKDDIAQTEIDNEKSGKIMENCNEWHRWFGSTFSSKEMLNTGVSGHISDTKSVIFYTKKPFSLQNFSYLKFKTDGANLPYETAEAEKLDPWSKKVLQWDWQQKHSQEVTFGFFLTVYSPTISGSSDVIKDNQSHIISKSLEGLPPQMFLIPDCNPMSDAGTQEKYVGWSWPCERTDITHVYPNFNTWVQDKNSFYGMNWFMLPKSNLGVYDLYPRDKGTTIEDILNNNPNDHSSEHNNSSN